MITAAIEAMRAKGMDADDILDIVSAMVEAMPTAPVVVPVKDEAAERRREADRVRKAEKRAAKLNAERPQTPRKSDDVRGNPQTSADANLSLKDVVPNLVTVEVNQNPIPSPPIVPPPTEKPEPIAKPIAKPKPSEEAFDRFWLAYPSRGEASNPKKPAREKFERAVKAGADPETIIAAAARYAEIERRAGRLRTDKVAQAMTWLNQQRWADYGEPAAAPTLQQPDVIETAGGAKRFYVRKDSPQWWAWRDHRGGKSLPVDKDGNGWWCDSEWPPGALDAKKAAPGQAPPADALF